MKADSSRIVPTSIVTIVATVGSMGTAADREAESERRKSRRGATRQIQAYSPHVEWRCCALRREHPTTHEHPTMRMVVRR
jgi:hypothetical protein